MYIYAPTKQMYSFLICSSFVTDVPHQQKKKNIDEPVDSDAPVNKLSACLVLRLHGMGWIHP